MKKEVVRKLRKSEIEFQKRCFKRRAKPKVTIRGDKASTRLYWDRGKRSGTAIERRKRRRKEEESEKDEESEQHGGMREHGRMSRILIMLRRIETKWH
ncbi:hypothetical protein TNCV_2753061 [Trichonephila clavipes]|nr:hypothetical protein TNCV_2753061 [Trichonephila clavipes]